MLVLKVLGIGVLLIMTITLGKEVFSPPAKSKTRRF